MEDRVLAELNNLTFLPSTSQLNILFEKFGLVLVGDRVASTHQLKVFCEECLEGTYDSFEQMHYSWLYGETISFLYNEKDKEDIRLAIKKLPEEIY